MKQQMLILLMCTTLVCGCSSMSEGNGGNNRPRPNPRPPSYSDKYDTLKYRLAQLESHRASLAEDNARLRSELASLNTRINQASLSANSNASINLSAEQLSAHPQLPMRLVQTVMTSTPIARLPFLSVVPMILLVVDSSSFSG